VKKLLVLKSSINGDQSHSSRVADVIKDVWAKKFRLDTIKERNLAQDALPLMDQDIFAAYYTVPAHEMTGKQIEAIAVSDTLIDEIKSSDIIVIAAPMYNFSLPNQLKNYFDLIIRAGLTFSYTETGRVGAIQGKKAIIINTSGGVYRSGENDFALPYLITLLDFIGITDTTTITIDGVATQPELIDEKHKAAVVQMDHFINSLS